ncbi:MAG: NUDIX domain-containing protein [Sulfurovum sp.]|nr:NUDIX domain-containing protein [Sulfurovum sp.]
MHENKIENFKLNPLENSEYIDTYLATYTQDGIDKDWEIVKAHDSVAILIYHKDKDAFVLVKQFRPAVYLNNNIGLTVELCAGIVDKDIPLLEIAREEIEEECGFCVASENIERITAFHTSVGFAGSKQGLYYAEVEESMKTSDGGGIDDEQIEVIYLSREEAKAFIYDESIAKTPGLMFAFMWWFDKIRN